MPRTLRAEQRDVSLIGRVRSEFKEMPGLRLTLTQTSRLLGISPDVCGGLLSALVAEGLLCVATDGRYRCRTANL
jgi:hypothetical protein